MPITIIENATEDQKAAYYENFNKGVSLTFGQKLKNRKQRELVSNALKMIGRNGPFELKELIDRVWSNQFKQTKNLRELELAFMILVSTMMGSGHFHTNYAQHSQTIMNDDIVTNWTNFRKILEMLDGVDNSRSVDKKKKRECFKKFIGAIIYDFWRMDNDELNSKWQEFFRLAYTELSSKDIKLILDVGTRRGNNISRIQGISINVTEFLQNNRTLVVVPGEPTENNVDENETEEDDTDED